MNIVLPLASEPADASDDNRKGGTVDNGITNTSGGRATGKNNRTKLVILAIVLGVVAGVAVWLGYQQKVRSDNEAREEYLARRKAHSDSLMMLRNQQEAEEREARQAEINQSEVISFLDDFYQDCFFGEGNADAYAGNLSEQCYRQLSESEDSAGSIDDRINWNEFGPRFESAADLERDKAELSRNFMISHAQDNWYRVRFTAHGMTEYREIQAFLYRGKVIINDYR